MHSDIVFPQNNEDDFIKIAELLGYKRLYFCYNEEKILPKNEIEIKPAKLTKNIKIKKTSALIIAAEIEDTRSALERSNINVLFELELKAKKDHLHQRDSGLNHILAKIAADNKKIIGFNFNNLIHLKNHEKSIIMGRIKQNIKLCRKYKVKTIIASLAEKPEEMRSPHDLIALFEVLGMHPKEAQDSLKY